MKYKFLALYELDSLAVVNVRDVGPVKNAFKVLMFPDTRMYQAENPKAKVSLVCSVIIMSKFVSPLSRVFLYWWSKSVTAPDSLFLAYNHF